MPDRIQQIAAFSLKNHLSRLIKNADRPFWCAFFTAFIALNLLFLFHGAHYMFGDHDWQYVKTGVPLASGLFEGRFTQFILINLLTRGEILPIVNNLIGFAGYSLGLALLARYWQLPHRKSTYAFFALFGAVTPYILSFMYFAFLILPVLSWSAFIVGGLLIAEKQFSVKNTLTAAIMFTLALGGYPPIINLIGVALTTRLLISLFKCHPSAQTSSPQRGGGRERGTTNHTYPLSAAAKVSPNKLGHPSAQTFLPLEGGGQVGVKTSHPSPSFLLKNTLFSLFIAIIIYKLCLMYLTHTGAINSSYYNLQTTPIAEWGTKARLVLQDLFKQFTATLPFIPAPYKTATTILTLLALLSLFKRHPSAQTSSPQRGEGRERGTTNHPYPLSAAAKVSPNKLGHPSAQTSSPQRGGGRERGTTNHPYPLSTAAKVSPNKQVWLALLLFAAIPLAALATLFISTSVAETEFSPRIDFFGLNYVYMAMLALCLHTSIKLIKNLALTTSLFIIFVSANQLFEAQKVWHLGFEAEQSLYRRILKRHEQSPLFNPQQKYIIVQAGSPSFRHKYYHTAHTHPSDDLLNISYTPGMNAGVMWNYLSPTNYADTTSYVYTFQPDAAAQEAIRKAAPYPATTGTAVGSYWILTVLTPTALQDLRTRYLP